jgi:hypothetical protein
MSLSCMHGASIDATCEHCPHAMTLRKVLAKLRTARIAELGPPKKGERSCLKEDEAEFNSVTKQLKANLQLVSSQPAELAALQAEFASLNSDENAT